MSTVPAPSESLGSAALVLGSSAKDRTGNFGTNDSAER
jgi:hypothetical protein